MRPRYYIGLGVTYHDPAIAIVDESGEVLFAEATERCLQYKRGLNCPPDPLSHILDWLDSHCDPSAEWVLAFNWLGRRPWYEHTSRWLGYFSPRGLIAPGYRDYSTFLEKYKLFHMLACQNASLPLGGVNLVRRVTERYPEVKLEFRHFDHHLCHAALACGSGPFDEAVCLIVDSFGERGSLAAYKYRNNRLSRVHVSKGVSSLGFFYMLLTELCGFDWLAGEEWKVMGLAAYGKLDPEAYALMKKMMWVDGLELHQDPGAIQRGLPCLRKMGCGPGDEPEKAADIAHTGQLYFTELVISLCHAIHSACAAENLVLGGGCALNSACNGQLLANTPFSQLHVPSAPADDGTALGAAWLAWHQDHPGQRYPTAQLSPYLGSEIDLIRLKALLRHGKLQVEHHSEDLSKVVAKALVSGKLVGWMQGRAEFGPRALGNRSILADPRDPKMKDRINTQVKFRESFRPFAPSILDQYGQGYFHDYQFSPYMERALMFRSMPAGEVPAVVHADGSGRVQSVRRDWNPRFYDLLKAFHHISGVPILLNTSLNRMGKPIVQSVEDAVALFMTSGLDLLVIDDYVFRKK